MWTHRYETRTDLDATAIWPIIADVSGWAAVDHNIERIEIDDAPARGARFMLKPRGGPRLRFEISRFEPPHAYADVCRMPLATMETTHSLVPGAGTTVRVEVVIRGPLAPLWGLLVGRKHASGLPAQTERILAAARQRAMAALPEVPAAA